MEISREHIVCGTDFSPASNHALAWAVLLARHWDASVDLVHVLHPLPLGGKPPASDARAFDEAALAAARERLAAVARAVETLSGISVRPQVWEGEPATFLSRVAEEERARLIVVGAHGHARSVVGRWIMGSVADRAVRTARVPVAVVPPPGDRRGRSLASFKDDAPSLRVLAGLALCAADARVVEFVAELRQRWPCDATFLHLYWPQEQIARLGLSEPRDLVAPDPDVIADLEPSVRLAVGALAGKPGVNVAIRPAWGQPAANLLEAAQEGDADLMVLGAEERHGLARLTHRSVAAAVARKIRSVPVVFVHPSQAAV